MNSKNILVIFGALAVIFFAAYVWQTSLSQPENGYSSPREIVGSSMGGAFELIDEDGQKFTDAQLTRPYRMIYFGFTFCPAICPTELAKIIRSFKQLTLEQQEKIDLVFITIDPERDTAEVIKQYTDLFHPRLIGLTGSQEQIDKVLKQYKVYATKVQDDTMSDYTMDHSSYIYLFNNKNQIRAMYRMDDEADFIAKDLPSLLH